MVGPDQGEARPVSRAEPPPTGLARSLSARFAALGMGGPEGGDDEAVVGDGVPSSRRGEAVGADEVPAPRIRSDEVHARERFTNRLARYLKGNPATRSELLTPLLEDVRELRESGAVGPLVDAALAVQRNGKGDGDPDGVDPLLGHLLDPAVREALGSAMHDREHPAEDPGETGSLA